MEARIFKLTLAYDGSAYAGWQVQPGKATIQGTVEQALADTVGSSVRIAGSGRTDAGVHALGQVASFSCETQLSAETLARALGSRLPHDIVIQSLEEAGADFHARRDAVAKRYRYALVAGERASPFERNYAWHVRSALDVAAMHEAAQALRGRHDFASYQTSGSPRETTARMIYDISARRLAGARIAGVGEGRIDVEIEADGFLYNMVRNIVGALVEVGRGVRDVRWPAEVLAARNRSAAGLAAPAQGLFLVSVRYADGKATAAEESH